MRICNLWQFGGPLLACFLVFWSSLIHPLKCLQNQRKGPEKWGEDDPAFLTGALASSEVFFAVHIFMAGQPTPPRLPY